MKRKILVTTMACVLIGGCASSPAPLVYENGGTTPSQPNEKLVNLNAAALERQSYEQERSGLMQKISELGNELSDLKTKLQSKTPASAAAMEKPVTTAVKPVATPVATTKVKKPKQPKSAAAAPTSTGSAPRETIVIQDTGMVFRVMHGYAKTDFRPSKSLQQQLLQAARAGKRIEIRGRTDAAAPNAVDREIAMQRALNARVFLANNGIHPRKMQVNYMAAGDHVASNATSEGRARNRRVEIETAGITPHVLEDMAAVIRHDLQ
ncbi:MAG: OmpA family protein [Pseudomonadota bacterium]